MVPGAVDVRADAYPIGTVRVGDIVICEVDGLHIRSVRACDDALRVRGRLVAWVLYLELLVQAQVLKMRVYAHVVDSRELFSCVVRPMSGKIRRTGSDRDRNLCEGKCS
jgi:hypothetical protein